MIGLLTETDPSTGTQFPLVRSHTIETRLYQQTVVEKAIQKNTLVVMPTALGKTIISELAAAHFLYNYRQMRVLVMAPTRPLVLQHYETYVRTLRLPSEDMIALTGKTPPAYRKAVWDESGRIIFATPQIVRNDTESGILSLENFSLLVFDECHRARKDYAYTAVARQYIKQARWPIILGMTASPGADREKITEICRALFIEQIEYRSEDDTDVVPYLHPVEVEWKRTDLPIEYKQISRILHAMLDERLGWLSRSGVIRTRPENTTRRDLIKAGELLRQQLKRTIKEWRGPIFNSILVQSASLTLFHALELLETQGIFTLARFIERIQQTGDEKRSYKSILSDPQYVELKRILNQNLDIEHPKLPLLRETIEAQLMQHPNSKILVFTQYRDTASHIVDQLRQCPLASVERFVGQASKNNDIGLTQDEQTGILQNFRDGKTNLLVATCIAEEGLDIPNVDLVVFYEPIPSEIRYIQRKGRTGRRTAGKAIILAANDTFDIAYLHASQRRVERMRRIVESLNLTMKPVPRHGPRPEPNPMNDEILCFEKRVGSDCRPRLTEPEESAKRFIRDVEKTSRYLWTKLLKTGIEGLHTQHLIEDLSKEGITSHVAQAAIEKLEKTGQIARVEDGRIAMAAVMPMKNIPVKTDEGVYIVEIENIFPGVAVVIIDGIWRARLTPKDFEGPSSLLKKRTRFRARGRFYHDRGVLCFAVEETLQEIERSETV